MGGRSAKGSVSKEDATDHDVGEGGVDSVWPKRESVEGTLNDGRLDGEEDSGGSAWARRKAE